MYQTIHSQQSARACLDSLADKFERYGYSDRAIGTGFEILFLRWGFDRLSHDARRRAWEVLDLVAGFNSRNADDLSGYDHHAAYLDGLREKTLNDNFASEHGFDHNPWRGCESTRARIMRGGADGSVIEAIFAIASSARDALRIWSEPGSYERQLIAELVGTFGSNVGAGGRGGESYDWAAGVRLQVSCGSDSCGQVEWGCAFFETGPFMSYGNLISGWRVMAGGAV